MATSSKDYAVPLRRMEAAGRCLNILRISAIFHAPFSLVTESIDEFPPMKHTDEDFLRSGFSFCRPWIVLREA